MKFPMDVPVVAARRTAVGRGVKGALRDTRPEDLAAAAMQGALAQVSALQAEDIEDVLLGCAMPEAEQGLNIGRNSVFAAGWPDTVPGSTVNRFCSSGLQAVAHVAQSLASGQVRIALAGGVESMSSVPMSGNKVSLHPRLVETRPEVYIAMGHTAERVAARFQVSRTDQDQFAVRSHQRAAAAQKAGIFTQQIAPVAARTFSDGVAASQPFAVDECVRPETSLEGLGKLKPAFTQGGSVTAGNSSPLSDGAAALILATRETAQTRGLPVLASFRAFTVAGVAPDVMGIGPVPAIAKLLKQCGLSVRDIDLFEINEAFAAQALYCQRELGIDDDRLNVHGGALAKGHPLGATGAKLSVELIYELRRRQNRLGVVSICIGGGMGAAGLFEIT